MPPVGRVGDMASGHDACAPTKILNTAGISNVTVNNKPIMVQGDMHEPHACNAHKTPHQGTVSGGSGSVTACNIKVARITDKISCAGPEVVTSGSGDVISG